MQTDENNSKTTLAQILLVVALGFIIAAVMHYRQRKIKHEKIIPRLRVSHSSRVHKIERFPHYVARQLGFQDRRECPNLCKLATEYMRKCDGFEDDIYSFFSTKPDADSLFVKLLEEFERCILSYFAFHWNKADLMISQVLSCDTDQPRKKLKNIVMAATREQRFERVTKNLKVARFFTTLLEEMKAMGLAAVDDSTCTEVMAPVAHADRSPVLLFMGGGMGAGKSTVLKDILKEPFWAGAAGNAVVIEADAFKESDVIYRALSSRGHHDMLQTAELTVTMARNVHRRRYRMGAGYRVNDDGTVIENYWERIEDEEPEHVEGRKRKPYRIELVGVVCDAYLAVIRGIR
ncbi:hypothetical protein ACLB2K_010701 [Fragaria x ananassa]